MNEEHKCKPGRPKGSHFANAIQQCRLLGMTQANTATALNISISTVKRYWSRCVIENTLPLINE
ncbi:sigma-70 family RNA polymerase sigma factor [Aeromonas schubertii]|nr:sigma-70 family RNA polymerase sigma factor [Aeromonas schubertii]